MLARSAQPNPWTGRMAGALAVLLMAAFGAPFLRAVMDIAMPGAATAAATLAMLAGMLGWLEALRFGRRVSHRPAATPHDALS